MKKLFTLLFSILVILTAQVGYAGPLHDAVMRGDTKKVTAILDSGTNVDTEALWSALAFAAEEGYTAIVDILIDRGADVNRAQMFLGKRITALRALFSMKNFEKTVSGTTLLSQRSSPNVIGWANYSKGQYQEAINLFKQAISLNPLESNNFVGLSRSHAALRQYDEAITATKRAIELKPAESENFRELSASYNALRQYDEAITAAKRAIELKSDNANAYNDLGAAYFYKKQFDDALMAYRRAVEIEPKNATFYTNIGTLFFMRDDYIRAIDNYKKTAELTPNDPQLLITLANTYRMLGKYDDALASVNKAIELQTFTRIGIDFAIESGYPVVKNVLEMGAAKKAEIEMGDKIIKIDGNSTKGWTPEKVTQSIRGAAGTQVTLTIERKSITKPFEKLITRETIIDKSAAGGFGLRSLIYRHKGNQEGALQDAEKAYSLDSTSAWALLSLGTSCLDQGKNDEATKLLSQVKDSPTARLLEATAYAKLEKMKEAANIYLSIPEEQMSPKNIPLMNDRMALLQIFKPFAKAHIDKARSFESKGQYKEALSELSEALKIAHETEAEAIQEAIFRITRKNPSFSDLPEDARKYVIRGEVLEKEGNFEQAATEFKKAIQIAPYVAGLYYSSALINAELKKYAEAIRYMKIYLKAAPDAPNAGDLKDAIIKWEFMLERGKTF